jgi:rRNA maturation RNase YbeY
VLITSDERIRELNVRFRGIDEPTDVLTFPAPRPAVAERRIFLGEVAVAWESAGRQAAALGHPLKLELAYLAIHGTLHLLGMNDETDSDRESMVAAMADAAEAAGLPFDRGWHSLPHEPALAGGTG